MTSTHELWKDMAGEHYEHLVRSKEAALGHLFHPDRNVRIAAINICSSYWDCLADSEFVADCRRLAEADLDEIVREHAICALGGALRGSKDPSASQFLANVVKSRKDSEDLRRAAYWALREIQFGLTEEDNVRRTISLMKLMLHKHPRGISEEQVKRELFGGGRFSDIDWDKVDELDWTFVNKHLVAPGG